MRPILGMMLAASTVVLAGASCGEKSARSADDYEGIKKVLDEQEGSESSPTGDKPAADTATTDESSTDEPAAAANPLPGVDVAKLSAGQKSRLQALVDALPSPCGKAHSLRKSLESDQSCKRAPFAARFVVELLADGAADSDVGELYRARYPGKAPEAHTFEREGVPHQGPATARVVLVEFFDYACPHCAQFRPVIHEAVAAFPSDVAVYYKMFPLSHNKTSPGAAQAAIAAARQGKFSEMHALLFAKAPRHDRASLFSYAESLGLDMKQFEKDFEAAAAQVERDRAEGEAAGITGTPTLYINGRRYEGVSVGKYLKMRIEEELAVNG